jgi:hypothetical protein
MDEEKPEDPSRPVEAERPRRDPPTIDLEASEVSPATEAAGTAGAEAKRSRAPRSASAVVTIFLAAVIAALTAALVMAGSWLGGWPGQPAPPQADQRINASIDTLTSRVANLEARTAKPAAAASDPALAARLDGLEKSVASLRNEIAGQRTQSEKLAGDLNAVKSAPPAIAPPSPDLATIKERLGEIERTTRAANAEIAQAANKPTDDTALRRVVAASMLDASVRQSEPFAAALAAAKALAPDPALLKPLDGFAATGVPNAASLCREMLTLVPKLSPQAPDNAGGGGGSGGIIDKLQAGAARLVRIERTDTAGNNRGAIVARATAAALRNDLAEARHELNSLPPADRGAAQAWLDKADQREAALAAARQFVNEAMAALARPGQ